MSSTGSSDVAIDRWAECRRVIAEHSRSFDLASRLFPRERRDEVAALYGWCRHCDDAIDLVPVEAQPTALEGLRRSLGDVYSGVPQADPVLHCFQEVVRRRSIPIEYPRELIEGMAMDVEGRRYADLDSLLLYCWRVAGTVGLMMCHVMGVTHPQAGIPAAPLGIARQLTNITRDVVEDWERGRVYVPASMLDERLAVWTGERLDQESREPLPEWARPALADSARALLSLADRYYASADAGLAHLEPRSALAVRAARLIYADIGRSIARRDYDVMRGRAVVSGRRKAWLVLRALLRFTRDRAFGGSTALEAPEGIVGAREVTSLR